MTPEEVVATELKAKYIILIHWAKFTFYVHIWTKPITKLEKAIGFTNIKMVTPQIGGIVVLDSLFPKVRWWKNVDE